MHAFRTALIALLMTGLSSGSALAQCAMCKAAAETSIREGSTQAAGLNTGILYLILFPYAAVALLGYLAWRYWRRKKAEEALAVGD
jgi:hypothetical protein